MAIVEKWKRKYYYYCSTMDIAAVRVVENNWKIDEQIEALFRDKVRSTS